jgi:hypothetical protein
MPGRARALLWLNVVGGAAVLASYVWGLAGHPALRTALWGGVPESLRSLYTVSMFAAAAGYFPVTHLIVFRTDPGRARVGRAGYEIFHVLYALVLVPSALWLPLTLRMIQHPGPVLWWVVRLDLLLVAAGSLGLLGALVRLRPRPPGPAFALALAGLVAFVFQTAVLDALVWPAYYPR